MLAAEADGDVNKTLRISFAHLTLRFLGTPVGAFAVRLHAAGLLLR
ncbi:hypothetical protein HSB1_46520 [Halogranum salarium B-1]|uniref:Uncharacterized protein n=1 Tax=Halogranum salarium B-1 TaxID=1210908 RepID=J2Z8A2_9EURY|nr:hypothetical protein HSB1_46520 [Halogranum salarium B-1]